MRKKTSLFVLVFYSLTALYSQDLVFSAIENSPPVKNVTVILKQAYQKLGINISIKEYPGLRGLSYANSGETDGEAFRIFDIDKEYINLIRIPVSIRQDTMHLFVKKGKEFVLKDWSSIPKSYTIEYQRGLRFPKYASKEYQIKVIENNNVQSMFLKLDSGRCDAVVAGGLEGLKYIQYLGLKNIVMLEPPIYTTFLYHYLNKKHIKLVPQITEILKEMENSGEIERIRKELDSTIN